MELAASSPQPDPAALRDAWPQWQNGRGTICGYLGPLSLILILAYILRHILRSIDIIILVPVLILSLPLHQDHLRAVEREAFEVPSSWKEVSRSWNSLGLTGMSEVRPVESRCSFDVALDKLRL